MENFNWTKFKEGKIIVYCKTIEEELNFLQECDKQGLMWCSGAKPSRVSYLKRKELDGIYFDYSFYGLTYLTPDEVEADEIERTICWTTQPKTKFTWKEVFTNIQEGETYEYENKFISYEDGCLKIGDNTGCLSLSEEDLFNIKKKPRQVKFQEAVEALKLNKTIESYFGCFYKLEKDGTLVGSFGRERWEERDITFYEIDNEWFIFE